MRCDTAREAISARIDSEDAGMQDDTLRGHLEVCAACREWQQQAHTITRWARLGGYALNHDLTAGVLSAVPAAATPDRHPRWLVQRAGLAAMALAQMAITIPLLILGHDHEAGAHAAHELGSFDLALAIAFVVGAVRPALSAGLAWPCGIAACGLAGTAIADLIGGQTIGVDEAQHLIAVAGAALLIWQARSLGAGGHAPEMVGQETVEDPVPLGWHAAVSSPDVPRARPGEGGDAASGTGLEVAASTADGRPRGRRPGGRRPGREEVA